MSSNPVKWYFYSMPDESKANLRYGKFCNFCWYYIQKKMYTEYSTYTIVSKSDFNRHWKTYLMKNAFQVWIPRQSWVYYQDLLNVVNILNVYCRTGLEIILTLTPIT